MLQSIIIASALALGYSGALVAQDHPCGIVHVPTRSGVGIMDSGERRCLEVLLGAPVQEGIGRGYVQPGETIDFSNEYIAFVYAWNHWTARRATLADQLGPEYMHRALDVQELERWNQLKDAWKRLRKAIERGRPR